MTLSAHTLRAAGKTRARAPKKHTQPPFKIDLLKASLKEKPLLTYIGGTLLNVGRFELFLASDRLGTRGESFLGPVSPPVHLSRGRGTQIGPCLGHFWVLWAHGALDLL